MDVTIPATSPPARGTTAECRRAGRLAPKLLLLGGIVAATPASATLAVASARLAAASETLNVPSATLAAPSATLDVPSATLDVPSALGELADIRAEPRLGPPLPPAIVPDFVAAPAALGLAAPLVPLPPVASIFGAAPPRPPVTLLAAAIAALADPRIQLGFATGLGITALAAFLRRRRRRYW